MSEEARQLSIVEEHNRRKVTQYTDEQRAEIVAAVFTRMLECDGIMRACEDVGVNYSTVVGWIFENIEWEREYERLKVTRSRVMMERALSEMYEGNDVRTSEARARVLMKQAALLNPKEFSERYQANPSKAPNNRAVSFTLNFAGTPAPTSGSVTIDAQPEDGDLP